VSPRPHSVLKSSIAASASCRILRAASSVCDIPCLRKKVISKYARYWAVIVKRQNGFTTMYVKTCFTHTVSPINSVRLSSQ
jgi:hypothetical protein